MPVALITGASSGLGYCFAMLLAEMGYHLVLVSNEKEKLSSLCDELMQKYHIDARFIYSDLARPEAAGEIYQWCRERKIQIEVLINNAGFFFFGEVVETPPENAVRLVTLHNITVSLLCQYFGREMKQRRSGHILNISSMSACMAYPGIAYYAASKRYIKTFSRALRTEMKDYQVNVTVVCPGAIATNLFDRNKIDYEKAIRYGVMMKPEKVARLALKAMFKKKAVITPGWINKVITFLVHLTPHGIILLIKRNTKILPADKS